jgi:hypothetical protein
MSLTATRWDLSGYTASTWTDIANPTGVAIINTLWIANGANLVNVQLRIQNSGGTVVAYLIQSTVPQPINAGVTAFWNGTPITLNAGDHLQFYGDATGAYISANGAT